MHVRYFTNGHGHYVTGTRWGVYKMCPYWIDVDNKVWGEPYHLYGSE